MTPDTHRPHLEDVASVGSRVSWSAILAGAAVALAIQFLLGILTATIAYTAGERADTANMSNLRAIWIVLVTCAALFAGGVVTSQLTAGENKMEAALYGLIMWATVITVVAHGAAAGRGLFSTGNDIVVMNRTGEDGAARVDAAKQADARDASSRTVVTASEMKRTVWYTFAGVWLSMLAATGGALVGAGPTFRLVTPQHRMAGHPL